MPNDTREMVSLQADELPLPCKWVLYRYKYVCGSEQPKYKDKLITEVFKQGKAIYYDEIFSPVVKMTTLRLLSGVVVIRTMTWSRWM